MKRLYTFILYLLLFHINNMAWSAPVEYLSCDNSINADRYTGTPDTSRPVGSLPGNLSVSPSGGAVYAIPIEIMPGIEGVQPELALMYNSQGGNGALGLGWSLSGGSAITRTGPTLYHDGVSAGVQYNDTYDRLSLDGQRLIGLDGTGLKATDFRMETETFSRIARSGSGETASFTVRTKDGQTLLYGTTDDSRVTYAGGGYTWLLKEARDLHGRFVRYHYTKNSQNNEVYLSSIEYTGMSSLSPKQRVEFVYGERADAWEGTTGPLRQAQTVLLTRMDVQTDGQTVWSYRLNYQLLNGRSCLASIEKTAPDGSRLNSTELMWETPVLDINSRTANIPDWTTRPGQYQVRHFSGDFDGDGISDILTTQWNNSLIETSGNVCTFTLGERNGMSHSPVFSLPRNRIFEEFKHVLRDNYCDATSIDDADFDYASYNLQHLQDVLAADYDGDGVTEMMFVCMEYNVNFEKVIQEGVCDAVAQPDFPLSEYLLPLGRYYCLIYSFKDREFRYKGYTYSYFLPEYRPTDRINLFRFDFDNDGRTEILHNNDIYQLQDNQLIKIGQSNQNLSNLLINTWADFNGDGLIDYVDKKGLTHERHYNSYNYSPRTKIGDRYMVLGVTDYDQNGADELIVFDTKDSTDVFRMEMRAGEALAFIERYEAMDYHVEVYADPDYDKQLSVSELEALPVDRMVYFYAVRSRGRALLVFDKEGRTLHEIDRDQFWKLSHIANYDLNADGKEDIICFNGDAINCIYYRTDDGYRKEQEYINVGKEYFFGDFNGDGHIDLLSVSNNRLWTFMEDFAPYPIMYGTRDGMGLKNELFYAPLTDKSVYTKGSGATYPNVDLAGPLWVVSRIERDNGVADRTVEDYTYQGAKANVRGKGFFGFSEMTVQNPATGAAVCTTTTFDTICGLPLSTMQTTTQGGKSTKRQAVYAIQTVDAAQKRFRQKLLSRQETDLSGNTVEYAYEEDAWGNVTRETVNYGGGVTTDSRTYYTLTDNASRYVCQPDSQTVSRSRDGRSVVQSTVYTYDANRRLKTRNTYYDRRPVSAESYGYNAKGFMTEVKSKAYTSDTWLTTAYEYDDFGRTVKETDPLGLSAEYTYGDNGQLLSSTDARGNETHYTYDSFGRRLATFRPDGVTATEQLQWCTESTTAPEGALYYSETTATGQPAERTYYDAAGRELRSEQLRFNNKWLKKDRLYDAHGRLWKVSLPSNTTPNRWDVYVYDEQDRPLRVEYASGKRDVWEYTPNTVRETCEGVQSTKTYDASGALLSVNDPGGTITYHLRPDGQPDSITLTGGITTRFEYDEYGRQLKIDDPSAGVQTYTYDDAGNVATQTDANGKTTSFTYDDYGRITAKACPEFTVGYTYTSYNETRSETSTNGISRLFTYDNHGRLSGESETLMEGVGLHKSYTYGDGRLNAILYQTQNGTLAREDYIYKNGHLTEIKLDGQTTVWKLETENVRGETTKVTTGDLTRSYAYTTDGFPTKREVTRGSATVFRQSYSFDGKTGNLEERTDETRGLIEVFAYDGLNRLAGYEVSGSDAVSTPCRISYLPNGNVESISGIGVFEYARSDKPYALTNVYTYGTEDPAQYGRSDSIAYTSFYRPASLTNDSLLTRFTYDASGRRVKMSRETVGEQSTARYYLGGRYEADTRTGQELLYIGGDAYSAPAVLLKDGGAWNVYYIIRDYLGSICALTTDGGLVAEYSYDPWGRLRDPETLEVYAAGEEPELLFGRGFTGHEHLTAYGLINMNARLYDPVTGRFLSPDPYVQSPDFSQAFNRYSYCWNNPLRYVDEDGEWIHIVIGAIIGGVSNLISNWKNIDGNFWKGLGYFGVGAAVGAGSAALGGWVAGAVKAVGVFAGAGIGAVTGSISGGASSVLLNGGNNLLNGDKFGKNWKQSLGNGMLSGAISGAIGGGLQGWKHAKELGANRWTGYKEMGNVRTYSADVKISTPQPDPTKECYAYSLEYADKGHGNITAQQILEQTDYAGGEDLFQVANKVSIGNVSEFSGSLTGNEWEQLGKQLQYKGTELLGSISQNTGGAHAVNITQIRVVDKLRLFGGGTKTIFKGATVWNPIGGRIHTQRSFLRVISIKY